MRCPHCKEPYGERTHVCADRERWTRAERDEWRAWARRVTPAIQFVGTFSAGRLGSRASREEHRGTR